MYEVQDDKSFTPWRVYAVEYSDAHPVNNESGNVVRMSPETCCVYVKEVSLATMGHERILRAVKKGIQEKHGEIGEVSV